MTLMIGPRFGFVLLISVTCSAFVLTVSFYKTAIVPSGNKIKRLQVFLTVMCVNVSIKCINLNKHCI